MTKPVQKRPKPEPFKQAERQWDLKRLYRDLVNADPKRQKLTSMEAVRGRGSIMIVVDSNILFFRIK